MDTGEGSDNGEHLIGEYLIGFSVSTFVGIPAMCLFAVSRLKRRMDAVNDENDRLKIALGQQFKENEALRQEAAERSFVSDELIDIYRRSGGINSESARLAGQSLYVNSHQKESQLLKERADLICKYAALKRAIKSNTGMSAEDYINMAQKEKLKRLMR